MLKSYCHLPRTRCLALLSLALLCAASCGAKDPEEIAVVLESSGATNLFNDSTLEDIVFIVHEITADNSGQDVAFPKECATATPPPAGCGFDADTAEFRLIPPTQVPKEATITLEVRGRDINGVNLFTGVSANFKNNPTAGPITLTVSAVP